MRRQPRATYKDLPIELYGQIGNQVKDWDLHTLAQVDHAHQGLWQGKYDRLNLAIEKLSQRLERGGHVNLCPFIYSFTGDELVQLIAASVTSRHQLLDVLNFRNIICILKSNKESFIHEMRGTIVDKFDDRQAQRELTDMISDHLFDDALLVIRFVGPSCISPKRAVFNTNRALWSRRAAIDDQVYNFLRANGLPSDVLAEYEKFRKYADYVNAHMW